MRSDPERIRNSSEMTLRVFSHVQGLCAYWTINASSRPVILAQLVEVFDFNIEKFAVEVVYGSCLVLWTLEFSKISFSPFAVRVLKLCWYSSYLLLDHTVLTILKSVKLSTQ